MIICYLPPIEGIRKQPLIIGAAAVRKIYGGSIKPFGQLDVFAEMPWIPRPAIGEPKMYPNAFFQKSWKHINVQLEKCNHESSSQWIPPKKKNVGGSIGRFQHASYLHVLSSLFLMGKNLHPKEINGWNLQITINHPWKEGKWSEQNLHGIMCKILIFTRWWSQICFYLHPENWRRFPNLTDILQMGWFNHQLIIFRVFFSRCSTVVPQAVEVAADVGDVTIFAANKNAATVAGQSMMGTDFKHGVPRISDQVEIPLGENSNGNMVKSINNSMYKMRKTQRSKR